MSNLAINAACLPHILRFFSTTMFPAICNATKLRGQVDVSFKIKHIPCMYANREDTDQIASSEAG